MKTLIISLFIATLLLTSSPIYAQSQQEQIIELQTMILSLQKVLLSLLIQLSSVLSQQIENPIEPVEEVVEDTEVIEEPVESAVAQELGEITQEPIIMSEPKFNLEIISPIRSKGLGREYKASPEPIDESNYIEIGVIVRDNKGNIKNDVNVKITATDETQNKETDSTGTVTNMYINDKKITVYYYHFYYKFKTLGKHTIRFDCEDYLAEVDVDVE